MKYVVSPLPLMVRWLLASVHVLALPLGLGAVWMRTRGLRRVRGLFF